MKPTTKDIQVFSTITDYVLHYSLPAVLHPLLTIIDLGQARELAQAQKRIAVIAPVINQFYTVFLKRNLKGLLYYGHRPYDFSEGVLGFSAPGQVFTVDASLDTSAVTGWMLLVHPALLRRYPLGKKMASLRFFAYDANEALHLSEPEERLLDSLLTAIRNEATLPIDAFSQDVIVSQLDVLLNYANRFYHRQFLTRRTGEHDLLSRFDAMLTAYFAYDADLALPTVHYFAESLNVSPAYLGDMLRSLTGLSTQQHIHQALIEKAKQLLLTTSLSINEMAVKLGFEYPQYFSRLFKSKTGLSPVAYRFSVQ